MQRNTSATAVEGLFVAGNPSLGQPATRFNAQWCNDVQEELCNAVTEAGIALSGADRTQLADAIPILARPAVGRFTLHWLHARLVDGGTGVLWSLDGNDYPHAPASINNGRAYGQVLAWGKATSIELEYTWGSLPGVAETRTITVYRADGTSLASFDVATTGTSYTHTLPTPVLLAAPEQLAVKARINASGTDLTLKRLHINTTRL